MAHEKEADAVVKSCADFCALHASRMKKYLSGGGILAISILTDDSRIRLYVAKNSRFPPKQALEGFPEAKNLETIEVSEAELLALHISPAVTLSANIARSRKLKEEEEKVAAVMKGKTPAEAFTALAVDGATVGFIADAGGNPIGIALDLQHVCVSWISNLHRGDRKEENLVFFVSPLEIVAILDAMPGGDGGAAAIKRAFTSKQ